MDKTLVVLMTSATTCVVENVITLAAGVPYDPPAGRVLLRVGRLAYVGPGFIGTLGTDGNWTFAPPAPNEEPPPAVNVQDRIDALEAANAQISAEIAGLRATLGS